MADTTHSHGSTVGGIDKAWIATGLIVVALALLDPAALWPTLEFTAKAVIGTAPFIAFAVLAVASLKATGAESLLARAFEGPQTRMVVAAAVLGGLSPFCSCEVIPFIAALLAVGVPLGPVMAFWLASPLMDPAMFAITAGTLGWEFALAKGAAAIGIGIMGGLVTMGFARTLVFADPLRPKKHSGCGCGPSPFKGAPVWPFWRDPDRRAIFSQTAIENGAFLLKWLTIAYLFEALMVRYVPARLIAGLLGGEGFQPILLGAVVGGPAYLNGYAAVPLVSGLLEQGMAPGAAMSFMIAGGVSCIPAAIAVWALVRPRIFAAYLGFAFVGAILAGLGWSILA